MSSTPPFVDLPSDAGAVLAALRGRLDRIDDAIHDLLMQRAEVVVQVGPAKSGVAFRPGREAQIIRRLLARHRGALPASVLPRLWRELMAATTAMQGSYVVAVCETGGSDGYLACAREHFGALTPMRVRHGPGDTIAEVSAGRAIAAVLPFPAGDDASWWTALLHDGGRRLHVVARLPFWAPRSENAPRAEALVVAAIAPDASGHDISLIGLEPDAAVGGPRLAAALCEAGFVLHGSPLCRGPGATTYALAEVTGLVADDDPRLDALPDMRRRPVVLGAYAAPVNGTPP